LKIDKSRLPYMAQSVDAVVTIKSVMFVAKVKGNIASYSIKIDGSATNLSMIDEWKLCRGNSTDIKIDASFELSVDPAQENIENLEELMLVVKYALQ